jgi:coatomer protein complex subunit alpha (xenin)|tara:strand:- start:1047 stop:2945 length:1899 start_codon:yes stop_codon:yes gene_type:complete
MDAGFFCASLFVFFLSTRNTDSSRINPSTLPLPYTQDERTRFNLALECGNIEVALSSAQTLDDKDTWHKLGVEALRQGNHQIVEFAYQKTKNFERLSFLYLITGNEEKLSKMLKIAEMRSDVMGQFHNALYTGDVRERVRILETSGHYPLAYLTAKTHGLEEDAQRLARILTDAGVPVPAVDPSVGKLLKIPTPITKDDNWPLLTVTKGFFEGVLSGDVTEHDYHAFADDDLANAGAGWGDDGDDLDLGGDEKDTAGNDPFADAGLVGPDDDAQEKGSVGDDDGSDAGWDMEDLELPAGMSEMDGGDANDELQMDEVFVAPAPGVPASRKWTMKSSVPGEHAAAGDFDSAMKLLHRQLGVVNFTPLKQHFVDAAFATHARFACVAGGPSLTLPLGRNWTPENAPGVVAPPALTASLPILEERLKFAYKTTTEGKFGEALKLFQSIIHSTCVLLVETRREVDEVKELVQIAKEYACALRVEIKRKEFKEDPKRAAELAAYFTHSTLQPIHASLSLRSAMTLFFKLKNYNTAAGFCRRLLELNPPLKVAQQAKQVLQACERTPTDEVELNYDSRNPFVVCAGTFTPIYRGTTSVACPCCAAKFVQAETGTTCPVCLLGKVGAEAGGLVVSPSQR